MIPLDDNGYFITGSDTDVGKTYIACQIVRQLVQQGVKVETRKPAESGCVVSANGDLVTHDALALQQANDNRESIERIAAYRYRAALAPPRAARLENEEIRIAQLIDACERDQADHRLIVEGAGGFYSPLAENELNADLASALQLPVVIVVNDRIGAVNQALMTIQAVESRQLRVAAIVLNQVEPISDHALFCCVHGDSLPRLFE
jgi:dethiobiotin synthetase